MAGGCAAPNLSSASFMDPASAIISIVAFGLTVLKKINELRKDIKGAPEQVRDLQQSCGNIQLLLTTLDTTKSRVVAYPPEAVLHLQSLCASARDCLEEVNAIINKVTAQSTTIGNTSGVPKISLKKWLTKRTEFEDASKRLRELRETLTVMVNYMHSNSLEFLVVKVISSDRQVGGCSAIPCHPPAPAPAAHPRQCGQLRCTCDCTCRCHSLSVTPVIPQQLARYIGQIYVSKQLLDLVTYNPLRRCNVATCRGDFLKPPEVSLFLPPWYLHGQLQASSDRRIHFAIYAPRTVPYLSPIIQAIWQADVWGVRDLFAKQQASIWDIDIEGDSVLFHACLEWQKCPSQARLDIVRFLVEAGADALLFSNAETYHSVHDVLTLGLFQYLLGEPNPGRSLAISIQTNSVAIDIFRALFNMDAVDALDDVFSRLYGYSDERVLQLLASLKTTEYTVARSSVLDAIRYTPLRYAIRFLPSSIEFLLAEGADTAAKPSLAYTAQAGRKDLVALLIDNGADVNMKGRLGRTGLHWACSKCRYYAFFELVRCAGDNIDWNVRTREGQTALDLFDLGVAEGRTSHWTSAQIDKFRMTIVSHMDASRLYAVEDVPLDMPGAFLLD